MKLLPSLIACSLGLAACGSDEPPQSTLGQTAAVPEVLVDADWLERNLTNPNVRILDLGKTRDEFLEGHIPGAQFVDWRSDITDPAMPGRFNIAPEAMMETLLGRLGVTRDDTIVLYDNLNSRLSTRILWSLRYYAHPDVRILDGGIEVWTRAGKALTSEVEPVITTVYEIGTVNEAYKADKSFIQSRLGDDDFTLVDGRPHEQYTGEEPGVVFHTGVEHESRGHIWGAQNVFWQDNFNPDGTFKSPAELRALYEEHGVTADKTVVTYCNEGLHASPPWFVLKELLGYEYVRLYDDSMAEWGNASDTAIVVGPHCMPPGN